MKRIIIITLVVIVAAGLIFVGLSLLQRSQPAETRTVTANKQAGVGQGDGADQESSAGESENSGADGPNNTPPPAKRTDPEILEVILKKEPTLTDANKQPLFTIVRAQKTANAWYVVTIKHKDPSVGNAKVILKDNGGTSGLVVIAGPGTYFDPDAIYLPNEVRALL